MPTRLPGWPKMACSASGGISDALLHSREPIAHIRLSSGVDLWAATKLGKGGVMRALFSIFVLMAPVAVLAGSPCSDVAINSLITDGTVIGKVISVDKSSVPSMVVVKNQGLREEHLSVENATALEVGQEYAFMFHWVRGAERMVGVELQRHVGSYEQTSFYPLSVWSHVSQCAVVQVDSYLAEIKEQSEACGEFRSIIKRIDGEGIDTPLQELKRVARDTSAACIAEATSTMIPFRAKGYVNPYTLGVYHNGYRSVGQLISSLVPFMTGVSIGGPETRRNFDGDRVAVAWAIALGAVTVDAIHSVTPEKAEETGTPKKSGE